MRRRFLRALPILSLALLGSNCEGGVRVDTRPPEQRDGVQDTSGLVVVVKSGTISEDAAAATSVDPRVVVLAALAVAAIDVSSPSIPGPTSTAVVVGPDVSSWSLESRSLELSDATHEPRTETSVSPIPEPAAILLFGLGWALVLARSTAKTRARLG